MKLNFRIYFLYWPPISVILADMLSAATELRRRALALPRRQVHLDFHTSEHIPDVGAAFDERDFQAALQLGRVNSVTLFAKCHHSWSYYPTTVGRPHPELATDLLGRQITACHAIGVRCPIYYPVGWSANDAIAHPEWCARGRDGAVLSCNVDPSAAETDERPIVSWANLCPGAPGYRELILEQTEELCRLFPVDGLFFDICFNTPACFCEACLDGMRQDHVDLEDESAVHLFTERKWVNFMRDCNATLHAHHPQATVFYNGMALPQTSAAAMQLPTHLELEDLPTTWGGYDKFPLRARYFANTGKTLIAMSGKFHTTWGEFGGFKSREAMRFETASMVAFGAACSFGDQLHPSGKMDLTTYRNIGYAYDYAQRIEEFGVDARPFSNLAIWPSQRCASPSPDAAANDQGVANILMEEQYSFEILADPDAVDLSRFQTIILTGSRCLSSKDAQRLRRFVDEGGSLLLLNESIFEPNGEQLGFDIGATYAGPPRFKTDYTATLAPLATEALASPFINYYAAMRIHCTDGHVLARIHEPYFDRTYGRYCSHQHAPNRPEPAAHVAAVQSGRVVYLAHPIGRMYHDHGALLHRTYFQRALERVHPAPCVRSSMPSMGRMSLLHQPRWNRYVLHLLYATPLQRGRCLVVEDQVPLRDVAVTLNLPETIRQARFPLSGVAIQPSTRKQEILLRIPQVASHEVILLEY
jgi:hypothetical protein